MSPSTQDGLTPLQAAIQKHHTEVVRKLLDAGADIDITEKVLHRNTICKMYKYEGPKTSTQNCDIILYIQSCRENPQFSKSTSFTKGL